LKGAAPGFLGLLLLADRGRGSSSCRPSGGSREAFKAWVEGEGYEYEVVGAGGPRLRLSVS